MRTLAFLVLFPAVLGTACTKEHACTLIGCTDQFTAQLRLPSGQAPQFDVDLTLDGVIVSCPAPTRTQPNVCGNGVSLRIQEDQTCTEKTVGEAVTLSCVGTGQFSELIEVRGTPATVGIRLRQGGTSQDLDTLSPAYQVNRPNGPNCEPTCKSATVTKLIASWP